MVAIRAGSLKGMTEWTRTGVLHTGQFRREPLTRSGGSLVG